MPSEPARWVLGRGCDFPRYAAAIALSITGVAAQAQSPQQLLWTGADSSNLSDPNNYSPTGATAPSTGDAITFAAGPTTTSIINDLPGTAALNSLIFSGGTYSIGGAALNLQPLWVNPSTVQTTVLNVSGGTQTISADVNISQGLVNNVNTLNQNVYYNPSLSVTGGGLNLTGALNLAANPSQTVGTGTADPNFAAAAALTMNVGSAGALSLGTVNASQWDLAANVQGQLTLAGPTQAGSLSIVGAGSANLLGGVTAGSVLIENVSATVGSAVTATTSGVSLTGANVTVSGSGALIGTVSVQGGQLTLDNTTSASNARLDGTSAVNLQSGVLQLTGNASSAVVQNAGLLTTYANDATPSVGVTSQGQLTAFVFSGWNDQSGGLYTRTNFQGGTSSLGGNERVIFTAAPTLVSGLLQNVTVNGDQFGTYDSTITQGYAVGLKAATTTTTFNGAGTADNVYISGTDVFNAANGSVNSAAFHNATSTLGSGIAAADVIIGSGQVMLTGTNSVAPRLDFGSNAGNVWVTGQSTLSGGLAGSNGASVSGGGTLALAGASTLQGSLVVNLGTLQAASDNVFNSNLGLQIQSGGTLNLGSTNQSVQSLTVNNGQIVGSGSVTAGTTSNPGSISLTNTSGTAPTLATNFYANGSIALNGVNTSGVLSATESVTIANASASGSIQGTNLVVNLSGATLSARNSYSGVTNISNGTTVITATGWLQGTTQINITNGTLQTASDAVGTSSTALNLNGGALVLNYPNGGVFDTFGAVTVNGSGATGFANSIELATGASLQVATLNVANGNQLFLDLAPTSRLDIQSLDSAPSGGVVSNVYINKTIGSGSMESFVTYNSSTGVQDAASLPGGTATALSSAAANSVVHVTSGGAIGGSTQNLAGVVFDTGSAVSGGTINITAGLNFYQDNTVSSNINLVGGNSELFSNAGTNHLSGTISSGAANKVGTGTLYLDGISNAAWTVSGGSLIATGTVNGSVNGQLTATSTAVVNGSIGTLIAQGTSAINGSVGELSLVGVNFASRAAQSIGSVQTDSASTFTQTAGNSVGAVVNVGTFNNSGAVQEGVNNYGTTSNLSAGTIAELTNVGTTTNRSGATIQNMNANSGTVYNYGTLAIEGPAHNTGNIYNNGGTVTIAQTSRVDGNGNYIQSSGTTQLDGYLANNVTLSGGLLHGTGYIDGSVTQTGGTIKGGDSPGTLTISGNLSTSSGSTILFEDFGSQGADVLKVNGTLSLAQGTTVEFNLEGQGETAQSFFGSGSFSLYNYLQNSATQGINLGTAGLSVEADAGGQMSDVTFNPNGTLASIQPVQPVPLPPGIWTLLSGLAGLALLGRKKVGGVRLTAA